MVGTILSVFAGLLGFLAYLPYMRDVMAGRVKPARASRIMFVLLMVVALLQQRAAGSGWTLAVTAGELAGSVALLGVSIKRGIGGLGKLDMWCYALLALSMDLWLITNNASLALHLTVLADLIAFMPTLVKTWRMPSSETPLFYVMGVVAPVLNVIGGGNYSYVVILFPLYLTAANLVELLLIYRRQVLSLGHEKGTYRRDETKS